MKNLKYSKILLDISILIFELFFIYCFYLIKNELPIIEINLTYIVISFLFLFDLIYIYNIIKDWKYFYLKPVLKIEPLTRTVLLEKYSEVIWLKALIKNPNFYCEIKTKNNLFFIRECEKKFIISETVDDIYSYLPIKYAVETNEEGMVDKIYKW